MHNSYVIRGKSSNKNIFSSGDRRKASVTDVLFDMVKGLAFKYNGEQEEIIGYLLR